MTILDKQDLLSYAASFDEAGNKGSCAASGGEGLTIVITSLRATPDGERIGVSLELCDAARALRERQTLGIATELFGELGLSRGEISAEAYEALTQAAQLSEAMRRAIYMLGYGANSARSLEQKLRAKGIPAKIAARAVERLADKGYLREESDALRVAQRSLDKGWGLRRILEDLRHRGYGSDAVAAAREALQAEEDFCLHCARAARKKSPAPPSDVAQRRKLSDFLMRYGYSGDEIRYALLHAWRAE